MLKKLITTTLYTVYNIATGNRLGNLYKEVKRVNSSHLPINKASLSAYLLRWGFDPVIENNPLMTKTDVKKWLLKVKESDIKSWAYTGGSYGEPLRVPYSKMRNLVRTATFRFYNEMGGYSLGDPFLLIRAKKRAAIMKYVRNETIFIPNDISENKMKEFVATLSSNKVKLILGYPSVIYELALYLQKNPSERKKLKVTSLISASEPLEDYKRKIIHDTMQVSFVDRYSNEEVGLIAQQEVFGQEYFVNKFGVYVEVVNAETNQPVKEGETGKVVVTDIYNDLLPIVRYDTGDLATVHKYKDGQLLSIKGVEGRVTEQIIATNGNPISPLMLGPYVYKPLSEAGHVFQYQFAQTGATTYELRLKAKEGQLPDALLNKMQMGLLSVLGDGAVLEIKLLDDIKPQPSGKRPVFKNEWRNKQVNIQ